MTALDFLNVAACARRRCCAHFFDSSQDRACGESTSYQSMLALAGTTAYRDLRAAMERAL